MEKYGVQDDDMITGLRNEEHDLMARMAEHMANMDKTASEEADMRQVQSRLTAVRDRITAHDLKISREY
jgi:hypothetical protein